MEAISNYPMAGMHSSRLRVRNSRWCSSVPTSSSSSSTGAAAWGRVIIGIRAVVAPDVAFVDDGAWCDGRGDFASRWSK